MWHMEQGKVSIQELADATGVTTDTIKKLRIRPDGSTSVANAVLIAGYFGLSVERFISMDPPDQEGRLKELSDLLLPDEQRMIEAQVLGVLRARGKI